MQQRNLNAKHSAAKRVARADEIDGLDDAHHGLSPEYRALEHGDASANSYIGLNRSCAQRRYWEVCCRASCLEDARVLSSRAIAARVLRVDR